MSNNKSQLEEKQNDQNFKKIIQYSGCNQQNYYCSIQDCKCSGIQNKMLKLQRCYTIQEVTEPSNTSSISPFIFHQKQHKKIKRIFPIRNKNNDCIANHTRSRQRN